MLLLMSWDIIIYTIINIVNIKIGIIIDFDITITIIAVTMITNVDVGMPNPYYYPWTCLATVLTRVCSFINVRTLYVLYDFQATRTMGRPTMSHSSP